MKINVFKQKISCHSNFFTRWTLEFTANGLISMLLNYNNFCSFGSRRFSKTHTVGEESPHIHQHCQLICFHSLGIITPNHEATLPTHTFLKTENLEAAKTQIVCGSLVPVSAGILKTITHLYYNRFWNYLSSNLKSGQSIPILR